jgi:hypothetical protein
MVKNEVLMIIYETKREKIIEGCSKIHNQELHKIYCLSDCSRDVKARRMRWVWRVTRTRSMRNTYKIFVSKPGETLA